MSDLKSKLASQLQPTADAGDAPKKAAFTKAARTHPRRITLDLTEADYDVLHEAAHVHRTTKAQLLRALLELAATDPKVMAKAAKIATRSATR